jgi:hypothetical protein
MSDKVLQFIFSEESHMNHTVIFEFINLFCSGVLAGSLFVIHYGVRTPLGLLDERSQIQMRLALIYRLRVMIPAIFAPMVLSGVAVGILDWSGPGFIFRSVGVLSLLVCFLTALIGIAPINAAVLTCSPTGLRKIGVCKSADGNG